MKPKFTAIRPSELVILAIHNLGEKTGSSEEEIIKFVTRKYALDEQVVTPQIEDALQRCLNFGIISYRNGRYGLEEVPEAPMEETGGDSARRRGKRRRENDGEADIADVIEREIREWKRKKSMTQNARTNSIVVLSADNSGQEPSVAGVFPATTLRTRKPAKPRTRSKSSKKATRQSRKTVKKKPKAKQSTRSRGRPPKKAQSKPGLFARAFGLRSKAKQKAKPKAKAAAAAAAAQDKSKAAGQEACPKICPKTCPNSVEKGRMQKWKESQKTDSINNKTNQKNSDNNSDLTKLKYYDHSCEKLGY